MSMNFAAMCNFTLVTLYLNDNGKTIAVGIELVCTNYI